MSMLNINTISACYTRIHELRVMTRRWTEINSFVNSPRWPFWRMRQNLLSLSCPTPRSLSESINRREFCTHTHIQIAPETHTTRNNNTQQSICGGGVEGVRSVSLASLRWQHETQKTSAWQQRRPNTWRPQHNVRPIRAAITTCKGRLKFYAHTKLYPAWNSGLGIDCVRAGVPNCGARKKKRKIEGLSAQPSARESKKDFGRWKNLITLDSADAQIGLRLWAQLFIGPSLSPKQHLPPHAWIAECQFSRRTGVCEISCEWVKEMKACGSREEFTWCASGRRWEASVESVIFGVLPKPQANLISRRSQRNCRGTRLLCVPLCWTNVRPLKAAPGISAPANNRDLGGWK